MPRIAVLAVPFAAALVFSPRLTLEQYELPKHASILLIAALILLAKPGLAAPSSWKARPPLLGFLAAAALSTLLSPAPLASLMGQYQNLEGLITFSAYGLLFLAGASLAGRTLGRFSTAVIAAAAISSVYALLQQAGLDPFPGEHFRNVRSFAGNPDFLAQQMAMAIPLAAGAALASSRISPMVLSALFLLVLLLTSSRAGTAAGLAGLAILFWLRRDALARNLAKLVVAAALFAAALALYQAAAPPEHSLGSRISRLLSPSGFMEARGKLWLGSARAGRDRPLFGCGTDMLGGFFLRHAPPGWASMEGLGATARKAHAEPLHFFATTGVIGLGCYLWLLIWVYSRWKRKRTILAAPLGAALAAYLLHNLASFGTASTSPVFWFLLGSAAASSSEKQREPRPWFRIAAAAGALIFGFLAVLRLTADGYGFRGNEADRRGRTEASGAMFAKASRAAPWEASYLARLGWALERQELLKEARIAYGKAFALMPSNGLFLGNIGRVKFAQAVKTGSEAEKREAFGELLKAVDMAPSQPTLYGAAIMAARKLGLDEEQERLARRLYARDPSWALKMLSNHQ